MTLAEHAVSWRARGLGLPERRNCRAERARAARAGKRLAAAEVVAWRTLLGVGRESNVRERGLFRTFEALFEVGRVRQYLDACKSHEGAPELSFAGLVQEDTSPCKRRRRAAITRPTFILINLLRAA